MALDTFNPYLFVSSGEQSNKFLTPTYAGGIAQFQAQRAQSLTGLTVRIDPIQEGTGDPSPSNIRPISGRTGLTATRCGKNLLDNTSQSNTVNGITWTVNSDGTVTANGTATSVSQLGIVIGADDLPRETNLYFSGCANDGSLAKYNLYVWDTTAGARAKKWDNTNPVDTDTGATANNELYLTTGHRYSFSMRVMSDQSVSNIVFKPMVRMAGASGTFEPYTGQTYPLTWQNEAGTVYGGTLDVVSGVLTVTHAYWKKNTATMDNSEDYPGWKDSGVRAIVGGNSSITYRTLVGSVGSAIGVNTRNNLDVAFLPKILYNNMTQTQWKALAIDVEFLIPLATPQTYQLTPTEVRTIAGYNQIYSDAGPVIDIKF